MVGDFGKASATGEGIVGWNSVFLSRGKGRINAYPEHFPQERGQILAIPEGIAAAAAVSQPDIQETVRTEDQLAAFVIGERLVYHQQNAFTVRIAVFGSLARVWYSAMIVSRSPSSSV